MEFRILGPFQVEDQGRELPLGGPAERHLLAVLLCLANEPVSMQRLIDELWEDDPPASARNIVQQYVSHLRHAFANETRLTTELGGYVLRVEDGELDWSRFRNLVNRARTTDRTQHSCALLREALSLWQGPALSGCGDGPTVSAERLRLEEAHLAAVEDRVDGDLELGRHCDLTAELESLVAQHPGRERLLGQLMLALYRCDRQPEALHLFADYRRRLGEQTGLEPSSTLIDLEAKIMTNDPGLLISGHPDQTATNLPQRLSSFVGREMQITELAGRLAEHRLVTLVGVGGIGKTSLALRVAGELLDSFPDGIWLVDLAPLGDLSLIGGTAAGVLGVSLGPRQEPFDAVTNHLRDRMALIVLDNCEHLVEGAAEFAHSVLQIAPDVSILATSREPLGLSGEALLRVPPLSLPEGADPTESEAVTLFVDRARLLDPEFAIDGSNAGHVGAICRQLDGIPLAIELAAARMSTMALDRIADSIDDRYELLTKGARTAPRRHQTLRALVDWSHDLLTEEERTVFHRLGVFAGSFTLDAARYVCGYEPLTADRVGDAIEQLVDASLIDPPDPGSSRFRMLETIRVYAQAHHERSGEPNAAIRRLATFLNEHGPGSIDGYPQSGYEDWYRWRNAEQDNFRAVLEWSRQVEDADVFSQTTIEFRGFLNASHLNAEAEALVKHALQLVGEELSHRRLLLAWMHIGDQLMSGDAATARQLAAVLYSEASAAKEVGPMGMARGFEAMAEIRAGDMRAALPLFEEAGEHLLAVDDPRAMDVLGLFAFNLARCGQFERAREVLRQMAQAGDHSTALDHRFVTYTTQVFGAWVEQYAGNLEEAGQLLAAEAEYVPRFGAGERFMYHLIEFLTAIAKGDREVARTAVAEIDRSVAASGSPGLQRDVATAKALYRLEVGDTPAAIPFLRASLETAIQYHSVADMAEVIYVVGDAAYAIGDHRDAAVLYAAALAGYDRVGIVLMTWQQSRLDVALEASRNALGDSFASSWRDGSAMSQDEMVAYAADYLRQKA